MDLNKKQDKMKQNKRFCFRESKRSQLLQFRNSNSVGVFWWCCFVYFLCLVGLGFELGALCLQCRCSTVCYVSSTFWRGYFGDGVLQTICLDWSWTMILQISTSQVIRIIGMIHQHLASLFWKEDNCFPAVVEQGWYDESNILSKEGLTQVFIT
jgi:hypothetical protein